jgi:hypothetical protein
MNIVQAKLYMSDPHISTEIIFTVPIGESHMDVSDDTLFREITDMTGVRNNHGMLPMQTAEAGRIEGLVFQHQPSASVDLWHRSRHEHMYSATYCCNVAISIIVLFHHAW